MRTQLEAASQAPSSVLEQTVLTLNKCVSIVDLLLHIHLLIFHAASIPKLAGSPAAAKGGEMIINTEWGAFNNSVKMIPVNSMGTFLIVNLQRTHLPTTPYDNAIDRLSINPKFQAFEKFISGMYLGELTRNVLIALIDATPNSLLFSGKSTPVLNKHYGLDTSFMSATEEAWIGDNSADTATYSHPPLGAEFKRKDLNPKVVAKLDLIRRVIAEHLGFQEDEVSLKDAAVRLLFLEIMAGLTSSY